MTWFNLWGANAVATETRIKEEMLKEHNPKQVQGRFKNDMKDEFDKSINRNTHRNKL